MNINNNIKNLRQNLPAGCVLVAVSKTKPVDQIALAYEAGQRVFGENKVQEMVPKHEALPRDIAWHMIGHLQSNKVKYIAPFVALIHSVDSVRLLEEIDKQAAKVLRVIPCLLQVHIAEEETKFGFSEDEVLALFQSPTFAQLKHVAVQGLMGMATLTEDKQQIRKEFHGLKVFFEKLRSASLPANTTLKELSMGMSGDFEVAIEEGATIVRVGSAIFGSRPRPAAE